MTQSDIPDDSNKNNLPCGSDIYCTLLKFHHTSHTVADLLACTILCTWLHCELEISYLVMQANKIYLMVQPMVVANSSLLLGHLFCPMFYPLSYSNKIF